MTASYTITYDPGSVPTGCTLRLFRRSNNSAVGEAIADGSGTSVFTVPDGVRDTIQILAVDMDDTFEVVPLSLVMV